MQPTETSAERDPTMGDTLLSETSVGAHRVAGGTSAPGAPIVRYLSGGESNVVLLVEGAHTRVVVKQTLSQLRVADAWSVDPARAQVEAAALRLLNEWSSGSVLLLLDDDPQRHALTIGSTTRSEHTANRNRLPKIEHAIGPDAHVRRRVLEETATDRRQLRAG